MLCNNMIVLLRRRVQLQQLERDAHVGGVARVGAERGARAPARALQPQSVRPPVCTYLLFFYALTTRCGSPDGHEINVGTNVLQNYQNCTI